MLLLFASAALAQSDDNTVTVTATRTVTLQPDQALLGVTLTAPQTSGLDDVLSALQGTGLAAGDLVSATTLPIFTVVATPAPRPQTQWQFSKAIAFSDLKNALTALATAQQNVQKREGFDMSYYTSSQVSQAARQSPAVCPVPTLLADAQTQAQSLASAAGARIGGIVSMAQGAAAQIPTVAARIGDFTQAVIYDPLTGLPPSLWFSSSLLTQPPAAAGCSLTVQFQLLR